MTAVKITDLVATTTVVATDLVETTNDPGGTPTSKKATITQVAASTAFTSVFPTYTRTDANSARTIYVGTSTPGSPVTGDIWIDTN